MDIDGFIRRELGEDRVARVEVREMVDRDGLPVIRIRVVLTDMSALGVDAALDLPLKLRERLIDEGRTGYPVVSFLDASEASELNAA